VLEQEKQRGNTFLVDVSITVDDPQGMPSDDIQDTLDYRCVCAIVQKEMQQPSDLLEHVAWRIKHALHESFPQVREVKVKWQSKRHLWICL
jgi:dihydroneopterin aldolase